MRGVSIALVALLLSGGPALAECVKGDCQSGEGVWVEAGKYSYVGQFRNGMRHGKGLETSIEGWGSKTYNGQFSNNDWNGHGVVYFKNSADSSQSLTFMGAFNDGDFKDGAEITQIRDDGIKAFYKARRLGDGRTQLSLMPDRTADEFCKTSSYSGCIFRFAEQNKEMAAAVLALGYFALVMNSDSSLSVRDISAGVKKLANIMERRQQERAQEFADRLSRVLRIQ